MLLSTTSNIGIETKQFNSIKINAFAWRKTYTSNSWEFEYPAFLNGNEEHREYYVGFLYHFLKIIFYDWTNEEILGLLKERHNIYLDFSNVYRKHKKFKEKYLRG